MSEYQEILDADKKMPHFNDKPTRVAEVPLVYHYRDLSSFWQILKSDSFWATNARFSNDEAEQQFGMGVIASLMENNPNSFDSNELGLDEKYIVCFCKEDDKLSQWRGYAPDGGVAMGFDLGIPRVFSVLHSEAEDALEDEKCVVQYVGLDKVCYIEPSRKQETKESYRDYCLKRLNLTSCSIEGDIQIYKNEIRKKAPFIKHSGFEEEDEWRLVFDNEGEMLDRCIRYRDSKSGSLRYPYIVVKAALPHNKVKHCVVRVCISEKLGIQENELVEELERALKVKMPTLVQGCHLSDAKHADSKEAFCTGCVLRCFASLNSIQRCRYDASHIEKVEYEYCLNDNTSCVVVSQGEKQEEVFNIVHKCVSKFCKENNVRIPVWCEGHLPLRKITVGPCINQKNIEEAIRHYCKHTYWLRDVEISTSIIPFRNRL